MRTDAVFMKFPDRSDWPSLRPEAALSLLWHKVEVSSSISLAFFQPRGGAHMKRRAAREHIFHDPTSRIRPI